MFTMQRPGSPEQLPLLTLAEVPLQFRLDERTRRIGMEGVASAKVLLAAQEARRLEREPGPALRAAA